MDGVGDEVHAIDAARSTRLQRKDGEFSLKAEGPRIRESNKMILPGETEYHEGLPHLFGSALEEKNLDRSNVLEHSFVGSHSVGDTRGMVKELTLRNYDGKNLAIVGTSSNRDVIQTTKNQWQQSYQMLSGSVGGSALGDATCNDNGRAASTVWEDMGYTIFPELSGQKQSDDCHKEVMDDISKTENKLLSSNPLSSARGIRTKMLSKSGFSEYFVKNTLKGKGIICRGPARKGSGVHVRSQSNLKEVGVTSTVGNAPMSLSPDTSMRPPKDVVRQGTGFCLGDEVNLREWLRTGDQKVEKLERLCIFRQIVGLVDFYHSQKIALPDLRPSCFKLLPSNQVIYLGSSVWSEMMENDTDRDVLLSEHDQNEKRPSELRISPTSSQRSKKQKFGENMNLIRQWPQFSSRSGFRFAVADAPGVGFAGPQDSENDVNAEHNLKIEYNTRRNYICSLQSNSSQLVLSSVTDPLEKKWYTSPEELVEGDCTFSSNIYCLGVLLFELLGSFDSGKGRVAAMSDIRHRILPPNFLSENPKEAGFCLWLLHPEPSSRPSTREILKSEVLSGIQGPCEDELSSNIEEDDAESDLLMHFLMTSKEHKRKDATKLVEEIKFLEKDIKEVVRRQTKKPFGEQGDRFFDREQISSDVHSNLFTTSNKIRLLSNINQVESAYFSMRSNIQLSDNDITARANCEVLKSRENCLWRLKDEEEHKPTDRLGAFYNGLCKYARYNKFEVRGILRNGDFNSSANVICSLSFDRDEDYFAAAGVSKKIKIYEFDALFSESVDVHYPLVEMSNRSKLSCVCWNSYIRNYLASTDYDGIVKLWDAGTGQGFSQYIEHDKRAWSVDFSQVDPTKFASGSDDCTVKLWSINERKSLSTIKNIANVCCVQFSTHSTHLLAFGSADYKTYCYDLRNASTPWCILAGHDRAVSFAKFLDSETLVSASTDNSIKLWNLNKTNSNGLSTTSCALTLKGHTNEKNFVGLSVADGYIACGSETNEVYAYYRSLPMPITSYKFGSIDPISGKETDDDNGQFVSSVCWRRKSDTVVAANSSGCIKVLQMV